MYTHVKIVEKEVRKMTKDEKPRNPITTESKIRAIRILLDRRTLLEALAEEAGELAQSALKCIRAEALSNNTTPKAVDEARWDLIEELTDVLLCAQVLELDADDDIKSEKIDRWFKRLGLVDLNVGTDKTEKEGKYESAKKEAEKWRDKIMKTWEDEIVKKWKVLKNTKTTN